MKNSLTIIIVGSIIFLVNREGINTETTRWLTESEVIAKLGISRYKLRQIRNFRSLTGLWIRRNRTNIAYDPRFVTVVQSDDKLRKIAYGRKKREKPLYLSGTDIINALNISRAKLNKILDFPELKDLWVKKNRTKTLYNPKFIEVVEGSETLLKTIYQDSRKNPKNNGKSKK